MKIVLTCGHPTSGYQMVHQVLLNSGLCQAIPSRREQFSAEEIQNKFCAVHDVDSASIGKLEKIQPGIIWQNLAVDLFVANLDQENWGWADAKTIHLLDFWRDFDPQVRFVLTYSSPATALTRLSEGLQGDMKSAVGELLRSWFTYNEELLRFYTRHQDRCLLINADAVARAEGQEKLLPLLRDQRGLTLSRALTVATSCDANESPILGLIAEQMLEEMPEIQALYQELECTADIFSGESQPRSVLAELAVAEYLKLSVALSTGEQALKELAVEKARLEEHSSEQITALKKALARWESEVAELAKKLAELELQSDKEKAALGQENDLLLLQLHQVQEELESHFLKAKNTQAEKEALEKQLGDQSAASKQASASRENEVAELKKQLAELGLKSDSEKAALGKENDLLLLQLHQVQEELESHFLKAKNIQAEKETLEKQLGDQSAALKQALASRESEVAQLKKQLGDQATTSKQVLAKRDSEVAELKNQLVSIGKKSGQQKDLEQENELLLLQLHQVQEELECYFLKYQDSKKNVSPSPSSLVATQRLAIDFKEGVRGNNWYAPEADGCWAGPDTVSTIQLQELAVGEYQIEIDIVDAMASEIVRHLSVRYNNTPLFFLGADSELIEHIKYSKRIKYPLTLKTTFKVGVADIGRAATLRLGFSKLISPASRGGDDQRMLAIRVGAVRINPLAAKEIVGVDLRSPIQGTNWYEAEADGRWAGPGNRSSLHLPAVQPGNYRIAIEVADAMSPEILEGTTYKLAGVPVSFNAMASRSLVTRLFGRKKYPRMLVADVALNAAQTSKPLEIEMSFPKLTSPAGKGSDDHRVLALRIANVTMQSVGNN